MRYIFNLKRGRVMVLDAVAEVTGKRNGVSGVQWRRNEAKLHMRSGGAGYVVSWRWRLTEGEKL